ncbi:substrate-binding domain-containing protein [bacterium]|nr:substrate-binding domain-containing protein [bacterium]
MALLFTFGCSNQTGQPDKRKVIAVVPKSTAHIYWQSVHAGALTAAQEYDVDIEWMGPPDETMKDQQISIVEDFITKRVDGIALAPQDSNALVSVVERTAMAKIPCVIFDSGVNTDQYVSFIATDNYVGGVNTAHEAARRLDNKGTCIIVGAQPGSESNTERERGFEETLAKEYPNIKIIDKQIGYNDREKSRAVTEDMLTAHPEVGAIFGPNEPSIYGALLAVQARQKAGDIIMIGFDASSELVEAMKQDEIHALVLQNPFFMGYQSVVALMDQINGKEVPKRIDTGVTVATKENMNEKSVHDLLTPDLSILNINQ